MKLSLQLLIVLFSFGAGATEVVLAPVTAETLRGTWEATTTPQHDVLWHMEIGKKDSDTYLANMGIYVANMTQRGDLRELISSKVSGGTVKLHFAKPTNPRDSNLPEIWVIGTGQAEGPAGFIDGWLFFGDKDPDDQPNGGAGMKILFLKGTWTRDLAEASKAAESAIKEKIAKP